LKAKFADAGFGVASAAKVALALTPGHCGQTAFETLDRAAVTIKI